MSETTRKLSAERAVNLLRLYSETVNPDIDTEDNSTVLFHVLTDLCHWAAQNGLNIFEQLTEAKYQYEDEAAN